MINNAAISDKVAIEKPDQIAPATTNSHYEQVSRYFTPEEYEVADANLKGQGNANRIGYYLTWFRSDIPTWVE